MSCILAREIHLLSLRRRQIILTGSMSTRRRSQIVDNTDVELSKLVNEINEKLDNVIFNGGFETLVKEVQNVEKAQREMLVKIDELHKVVYEPDDGLFARVKKVESIHREEFKPIQNDVRELLQWKTELLTPKDGFIARTNADHATVEHLWNWKNKMIAVGLSATGATLLMVGKMIWEFITNHVTLR